MTIEDDDAIERTMGALLRTGVLISAAVVAAGGLIFLLRHHAQLASYATFAGEPEDLRTIHGVIAGVRLGHGRSVIQLGTLLLVMTPVARVAFSAAAFARERDWLYVSLTAVVLILLLISLFGG